MKAYLAGASSEAPAIAAWVARLRAAGVDITHDWTHSVLSATKSDREFSHDERLRFARQDHDGVRDAGCFWLQVPTGGASVGAWVELGLALGLPSPTRDRIVVVSGDHGRTIFGELADSVFDTHEEAFSRIVAWAR